MRPHRRRFKARRAWVALTLGLTVLAPLACGGEETIMTETNAETRTVTETETAAEAAPADDDSTGEPTLAHRCDNGQDGYSARYPEGWHANPGDVSERCSFFHPEPFELPEATEAPDLAISISREPVAFEQVAGDDPAIRVLEREETEVDGHSAVRRETEATGHGLLPAGVRGCQYLVDLGGETLVLATYDVGDLELERNRDVLDKMAEALEID